MKKGLLGSTAIIGATVLAAGVANAAEAPTWKLNGVMNFQVYVVDRDSINPGPKTTDVTDLYFGVDESELHVNVSGTADNGLNYGFKIELQTNTDDGSVADEARLQLSGGWGTLQLGDEDGAEDIMNYGGENVMGATGGFDGDQDDVAFIGNFVYPSIAGDTSDSTKISYFSPRMSGFQIGASFAPNATAGDPAPLDDTVFQNWIGAGANYDNSFGGVRVRASAVYGGASYEGPGAVEDISSWAVGGIVGFGPVSVGANYADNGDSGAAVGSGFDHTYWNAAAGFETGPIYLAAGYTVHEYSVPGSSFEPSAISVTADYSVAPGLGVYAEYSAYDGDTANIDATVFIAGAQVSF